MRLTFMGNGNAPGTFGPACQRCSNTMQPGRANSRRGRFQALNGRDVDAEHGSEVVVFVQPGGDEVAHAVLGESDSAYRRVACCDDVSVISVNVRFETAE